MGTTIDMMYVVDQSKDCLQIYFPQKMLVAYICNYQYYFFVKSIISDMHYRITYMSINFHQNRVSRSVKPVRTNTFAKKLQVA